MPAGAEIRRLCGYRERSSRPVRRREVPSGDVTLIISLGPAIDVDGHRRTSFLASLHDSPALTAYHGDQHGIEVNLTPLGARRLFGVPMHELTNEVVDLDALWGRSGSELSERLDDTEGWAARLAMVECFLTDRLAEARPAAPEVSWAWHTLRRSEGRVAVADLREELGWSARRIVGEFREQIGMAPKALSRVLRFNRAVRLLGARGHDGLAEIALDCGYYDQPHLNRDFRQFAGTSPTAYLANVMPASGGVAA